MINRGCTVWKIIAGILFSAAALIGSQSVLGQTAAATAPEAAQPEDIQRGQDLFEGKVRFAKGGPSCNACHHVTNDKVIGGGVLAADLTLVFSRAGTEGINAMLGNSPFPVMGAAYRGKDITEQEAQALVAFLQHVDKEQARHLPREYGLGMFGAGIGGVVVLAGVVSLTGRRRKRGSVNQAIYDRQIRSE
jgi:mono/diheme cytochrome c family protein